MQDFNFFETYTTEPEKKKSRGIWGVLAVVFFLFALVVWSVFGYVEIRNLENEIASAENSISYLQEENDFNRIDRLEEEVNRLQSELNALKEIESTLQKRSIITPHLIDLIARSTTEGMAFDALNIAEDQIQIQGNSTHPTSIAQMEHNIRNSNYFEDVFVPHITETNGLYSFSISFQLKGGMHDEVE